VIPLLGGEVASSGLTGDVAPSRRVDVPEEEVIADACDHQVEAVVAIHAESVIGGERATYCLARRWRGPP
jgi:hypothetical protein